MRVSPSQSLVQAKSAARSAFESAKQRFFNHLITAMKTPALIAAVERDLRAGHAAVIQIVERRVNQLGTVEPLIQRQGTDRILVQVPGLKDPKELKDQLGQTARGLTFILKADQFVSVCMAEQLAQQAVVHGVA